MPHTLAMVSPRNFKDRAKATAYLACAMASRGRVLAVDLDIEKRVLTDTLLALETGDMKTLFGILTGTVKLREAIYELRNLNPMIKVPRDTTVYLLPARRSGLYDVMESSSKLFKLVEIDELRERLESFLKDLLLVKGYDYILVDSPIDVYPFTPRVVLKILKDVVVLMEPSEHDLGKVRELKTAVKDVNIVQVILYRYDSEKHTPKPKTGESWEKLTSKVLDIPENVVVGVPGRDIYNEMLKASIKLAATLSVPVKPLEEVKPSPIVKGERLTDPFQLARIVLNSELLEIRRVEASKCIDELKSIVGDGTYYVVVSPKSKEWIIRLIYKDRRLIEASLELKDKTLVGDDALKVVEELKGEAFADISLVKEA